MFGFFKKKSIINNYQKFFDSAVKDIATKYGDNWQIRTMITNDSQIMISFGITHVISLKPIPPFNRFEDFKEDQVRKEVEWHIKRVVEGVRKQVFKELGEQNDKKNNS